MTTPTNAAGLPGTTTAERSAPSTRRTGPDRPGPGSSVDRTHETKEYADVASHVRAIAGIVRTAAEKAARRHSTQVNVPVLGTISLPATDELAFLGGVAFLAVVGAIEWPVAVLIAAGHTLAASHRSNVVCEFGRALEEA